MCTNPQTIYSRSRRYRLGISQLEMDVPCGHCPECVSSAHDEWFLRIWQEIQDYNSIGGKVCFFTLTYDDRHLPIYSDFDENTGEFIQFPCFNKRHMEYFLHHFRDWLDKGKGLTGSNMSKPIHYFWASEYGMDERFTKRPHYHPLLFLPPEVVQLFSSEQELKEKIADYWPFGMVRFSKPQDGGLFVQREFAGVYCSKYVGKDVDFYSRQDVKDYLFPDGKNKDKNRYEKFKAYRPAHWQSKSFGIGFTELCQDDDVFINGIDPSKIYGAFSLLHRNGSKKMFKVPRYIERKCLRKIERLYVALYDDYGEQLDILQPVDFLVLNDRGKNLYINKLGFKQKLEKLNEHNSDYLNIDKLAEKTGKDFQRAIELQKQFERALAGRPIWLVSAYMLVYRGLIFSRENTSFPCPFRYKKSVDPLDFYLYTEKLYNSNKLGYSVKDPFFQDGFVKPIRDNDEKVVLYNEFPLFAGLDEFCILALSLKDEHMQRNYIKYMLDREDKKMSKLKIA